MILATTPQLEGQPIQEYKGIVSGETIIGANILRDIMASITDVIGGRSRAYENALLKAKNLAEDEMMTQAKKLGANAIVGIDFDFESIGKGGSMFLVSVTGTAVIVRE